MFKLKLPRMRARVSVALWAAVGMMGGLLAVAAMLQLAGLGRRLPWIPLAGSGKGSLFFAFIIGVSVACLGLWGIYSKTVHAREAHF
jgi:hypothetical protein